MYEWNGARVWHGYGAVLMMGMGHQQAATKLTRLSYLSVWLSGGQQPDTIHTAQPKSSSLSLIAPFLQTQTKQTTKLPTHPMKRNFLQNPKPRSQVSPFFTFILFTQQDFFFFLFVFKVGNSQKQRRKRKEGRKKRMSFQDVEAGRSGLSGQRLKLKQQDSSESSLASSIFQINTAVSSFHRLVNSLGTPKDTLQLRDNLYLSFFFIFFTLCVHFKLCSFLVSCSFFWWELRGIWFELKIWCLSIVHTFECQIPDTHFVYVEICCLCPCFVV